MTNRGRLLGLPDRVAFSAGVTFFHVNVSRWGNPPNLALYQIRAKFNFGGGFASFKVTIESHSNERLQQVRVEER